ncbi:MAG: hypothetical protein UT48_C0022G0002 [Parcubacteria group bacterium GW2011_GWE2_39_37]|uniref:Uncharacterized protein n=1 Tax=Candidatus Falkowbacteria bacterium GW2011_GWF2_39_8 TaxID=1618642 RepID=A0A0G0PXZ9_9BACT|nr:MAG: hypothetical protein UT48_C0022G0002 [Parcubacteria group bacterium GW2011_GWE2_39_37]KKR33009.1 MAG: hypothetical protein UT64_C0016G0006 [Candidatus Falkowbacteria bacterium GW2011_GWF2_39_8]
MAKATVSKTKTTAKNSAKKVEKKSICAPKAKSSCGCCCKK